MRDFGELEISNVMASLESGIREVVGDPHPRRKVEIEEDKVECGFGQDRGNSNVQTAEVDVVNFPAMQEREKRSCQTLFRSGVGGID